MDSNYLRIAQLMDRYLNEEITAQELNELQQLQEFYPRISNWLEDKDTKREEIRRLLDDHMHDDMQSIWEVTLSKAKQQRKKQKKKSWLVAASVVAVVCLGFWGAKQWSRDLQTPIIAQKIIPVQPGKEQAVLTLSNGKTVFLGEKDNAVITEGGGELKVADNQLVYAATSKQEVHQHKLRVPVGGTYRIQLHDGTIVWLNADSEISYPSVFTGSERLVEVKGEAYFEVAKDPARTFRVKVGKSTIEAIGTAFNINTHLKQGQIKTILTEGRIRVGVEDKFVVIDKGNATLISNNHIAVEKADLEEALAWKEGYFYFGGKDLKSIMNEVSRWYDVDIVYKHPVSDEKYEGGIKRTESIQAMCAVLEGLTGFDVQINNRTLVIK